MTELETASALKSQVLLPLYRLKRAMMVRGLYWAPLELIFNSSGKTLSVCQNKTVSFLFIYIHVKDIKVLKAI